MKIIINCVAAVLICSLACELASDQNHHVHAMQSNQTASASSSRQSHNGHVCHSDSCNYFASNFLANLRPRMFACDDFYDFVCHKSENKNVMSVATTITDERILSIMTDRGKARVKPEEEDKDKGKGKGISELDIEKNSSRLRNLFESCIHPGPNNVNSLLDLIRKLGGFPLVGETSGWNQQKAFDWQQTTIEFLNHGLGVDLIIDFGIRSVQGQFLFSFDLLKEDTFDGFDVELAEDVIRLLYPTDSGNLRPQLQELMTFRGQLSDFMKSSYDNTMFTMTVEELASEIPQINFLKLIKHFTHRDDLSGDYIVFVAELRKLKSIAEMIGLTKPEVLANHMFYAIIEYFAFAAPWSSRKSVDAERKCVKLVEEQLGLALSVEYYERFVTKDAVDTTSGIISNLKTEIKLMLDEAKWISSQSTRSQAEAKIDSMRFDVGINNKLIDTVAIEWFYRDLELDNRGLVANLLSIAKNRYDRIYVDIVDESSEAFEWIHYDAIPSVHMQAYYSIDHHKVLVLGGLLDSHFVDGSRLASINYGLLGFTIAHEMMHALEFDPTNDNFNWLDAMSEHHYQTLSNTMIAQYDGLRLHGADWTVNGRITLSENIPDNAGLVASYRAFKRWLGEHPREPSLLNGVQLSANQLFWASFATRWCRSHTEDVAQYKISLHSPARFRVNIPVSNCASFALDYKCPAGARMNPLHRCVVC